MIREDKTRAIIEKYLFFLCIRHIIDITIVATDPRDPKIILIDVIYNGPSESSKITAIKKITNNNIVIEKSIVNDITYFLSSDFPS
ncbi:MAG: hypothetical protein ACOCRK_03830 [bacterium]